VQSSIKSKSQQISQYEYLIQVAQKAYNDTLRVYEAKLVDYGIPPSELNFQQLDSLSSTIPAGLVTRY
jgi:hypothetical protein